MEPKFLYNILYSILVIQEFPTIGNLFRISYERAFKILLGVLGPENNVFGKCEPGQVCQRLYPMGISDSELTELMRSCGWRNGRDITLKAITINIYRRK